MNINLTLILQLISFAVFVWFCAKYVWPPVMKAMQERQQKIAEGLDAADQAKKDLELAKGDVAKQIRDAKDEAASILEQANRRANQIVEDAKTQAREESERIVASAQSQMETDINQAREALRQRVSELTVVGAEKILGAEVDAKKHSELLDKLAAEL
ncbi:F0F1 ATP synthase subunit B [Saccharospirillum mangrovi]|uniref:F0F1 ATP synthase subunit B n=1 Tax=Saccharospirillum mangrovi TaxID=2161747 RepID=UPI000D35191A|nr:F0F1 ATP synthase subunit B [Saccharospirillum mangrovi]